jgi:hypothetical protein
MSMYFAIGRGGATNVSGQRLILTAFWFPILVVPWVYDSIIGVVVAFVGVATGIVLRHCFQEWLLDRHRDA